MNVATAAEHFLFMTLRIETERSVGTGFIFEHKWRSPKTGSELTGMFLITNKHVIANADQCTIRFTLGADDGSGPELGKYHCVKIARRHWKWWVGHPVEDVDIAVFPLTPIFDMLSERRINPFFSVVDAKLLPENSPFGDLNALERILFVGYPDGVYDAINNLPVIRSGITATPPGVDYEGRPMFLVDASVFPGSSGSPIFAYDRGAWLSGTRAWSVGSERVVFLGVLAAAFYRKSDGSLEFRDIPTTTQAVPVSREMIDLGVAYKAVTVLETIEVMLRRSGEMRPCAAMRMDADGPKDGGGGGAT